MTSVRESLHLVGKSASITQLAQQRKAVFPLSLRQFVGARSNSPIKHVFVLMLENRSFDHMLGFSGITGTDAATGQPTAIDGLTGNESNTFLGRTFTVQKGAPNVWAAGPRHDFDDVVEQLCGPGTIFFRDSSYPPIRNSGFVASYAKKVGTAFAGDIMQCYSPDQVPILTALAREFVVCDRWFSSMPGPTEPNRFFVHAATSGEFDDSPSQAEMFEAIATPGGGFEFRHGTVFDLLEKTGIKYRIYAGDAFPFAAVLDGISVLFDIREFENFADDLQKPSFDAGYIHIEPSYDVFHDYGGGNSQHPIGSVSAGERLTKDVYEAIRNSPLWEKSMLIITYDEHGGYYDHVAPGPVSETGERGRKHGFTFNQLGPRVPAIIVSPLTQRNLIEHRPFDHTDIIATLRRVFLLPSTGDRDGVSGGVAYLAQLGSARTDAPVKLPDVAGPRVAPIAPVAPESPPPSVARLRPDALLADEADGDVTATLHSAAAQHLQIAPQADHAAIVARVRALRTRGDAFAYLKEVEELVRRQRAAAGV